LYDLITPVLDDTGETIAVSGQMRHFFGGDERTSFDFTKAANNQNVFNGNNGLPVKLPTNYAKMAAFPNPNMTMGQFNQMTMSMKGSMSTDRSMHNMSSKDIKVPSLNNMSRDSRNGSRVDLNSSRKNASSSKNNLKGNKSYQVALNDDINLIERIEGFLNQITLNHNKVCPFCSKTIDIKKCNFQNISAFLSNTTKKYYLTHFDCYLKSNSSPNSPKILSLAMISDSKVNSQINALNDIETSNFIKNENKAFFVSIEGYHPISSFLLFKIEKIYHGLEHAVHKNQLLYMNLGSKSTSIFDPVAYTVPYGEFRLVITIHMSHSNEDPHTLEFLMDLTQVKLGMNQKSKFAEVFYLQGGNNVAVGTEIIFDPNNEAGVNKSMLDSSFQSTGSTTTTPKPDFGKNLFVALKHISVSLPLKRIEIARPSVEVSSRTSIDENISAPMPKPVVQKKFTKLQLNPNAPLFSNNHPNQNQRHPEPVHQQGFYHPQQVHHEPHGFNQNPNQFFQPNNNVRPAAGNPNYFNAPLFPGFGNGLLTSDDNNSSDFPPMINENSNANHMPPGLFNFFSQSQPQNQSQSDHSSEEQIYNNNNMANKGTRSLYIETKTQPQQDSHSFIKEEDEPVDTPEIPRKFSNEPTNMLVPDRSKSKGQNNLYTAVLSGKFKAESIINSPALNKIHNQYFSEISSGVNTPDANTPLYSGIRPSFAEPEEVSTPLTEDMIANFTIEDYQGRIVEFAKTYNGSRVLQRFFPRAAQHEVEIVINEIQDHIEGLMLDPYANYMFQTLAQSCSSEQRYHLLKKIAPSMIRIACDRKGTHSLQAVISLINRDVEDKLIEETLNGHVVNLAFDSQGTHLIQKLITAISTNNIHFIYKPLVGRFLEVANNAHGLCVLKQLMTKVEKVTEFKREIINLIHINFEELVQNPFGNYAIQHAFDVYVRDCEKLIEKVVEKVIQYSNQKFSSNVVEKCISISSQEMKKRFAKEILKNDRIVEIMKNKYGNYVILKILGTSDLEDKQAIMQSLARNTNLINTSKYKNRWIQFIEENPLKIPGTNRSHRPSIFKNNNGASGFENNHGELNSPMTADEWNNLRQAAVRRGSKELQDDRSKFFHENNNRHYAHPNGHYYEEENINRMNLPVDMNDQGDEKNFRHNPNNNNQRRGNNMKRDSVDTPNTPKKNKSGNHNQKFYTEKSQHHQTNPNKAGYNYFY